MRFKKLIKFLLLGSLLMTNTLALEKQTENSKNFLIEGKDLFFELSINGETIKHNRMELSQNNPDFVFNIDIPNIQKYLENGENEIVIEIGATNWFDDKLKLFWKKNKFNPGGYANFYIPKYKDTTDEDILSVTIVIDKNGKPIANESDVEMIKYKHKGVEEGHINRIFWTYNTYPKNMTIYKFTKKIIMNDLPERAWSNSEKYTDTKEQREKLEKAYTDLWHDINNRDLATIKKKTELFAWEELANVNNISLNELLDEFFLIKDPNFSMLPINFDDFIIKTMNEGRTVMLVNKTVPTVTPLIWGGRYSLGQLYVTFALVDGEFKVVR